MTVDGCGLFCKYILFVFNLIFAVVGFVFLGFGVWVRFKFRVIFEIQDFNSSAFVMGVTVLIALGSVMLIVVVFGDYGACNEKRCALQVFSVLLTIMAMGEVAVGVLAYSMSDKVGLYIAEFYTSMYTLYLVNGDPAIGVTLTFLHKMLHCCGATGIKMLELAKNTCPAPESFTEHLIMPNCPGIIVDVFNSKASLVMGIFIGTGALLITALVCSSILMKEIKKGQQAITAYYSTVY